MPIDPTQPEAGQATTKSVRDNFQATIDDLAAQLVLIQEKLDLLGGTISGDLTVDGKLDVKTTDLVLGVLADNFAIHHVGSERVIHLFGGNAQNDGGGITLWGSTHATAAGDIRLRSGLNAFFLWDESAGTLTISTGSGAKTQVMFLPDDINAQFGAPGDSSGFTLGRGSTTGTFNLAAGTPGTDGGNIRLRGSGHATTPGGLELRSGGNEFFLWDESAGTLTFSTGTGVKTQMLRLVDQNVIIPNIPTSAAGLPSGTLWSNGGVVNITP